MNLRPSLLAACVLFAPQAYGQSPGQPEPLQALGFTKTFTPAMVFPAEVTRLTFTIDNTNDGVDVNELAFVDIFPLGIGVSDFPDAMNTCGGTFAPSAGDQELNFSGGVIGAGGTCALSVNVRAAVSGMLVNTSSVLSSDLPDGLHTPGASATLTVREEPLTASVEFVPATIPIGGVSTLTYNLVSTNTSVTAGIMMRDMLPAGVVVAPIPNVRTGCFELNFRPLGQSTVDPLTVVAPAGGDMISFARGILGDPTTIGVNVAPVLDCMIMVDVTSGTRGSYLNRIDSLTSLLGDSALPAATLTVGETDAPGFAKAFSPATVAPGEISTLTFTIDNAANSIAVGSLGFADDFPDGLVVADSPNASTTCGGTFAPAASAIGLAFTGGSVAAGAACTIAVDVVGLRSGTLMNTSDDLTSDLSVTTAGAVATLTVNEAPLSVTMSFEPATISVGDISTLTYELDNGASVAATAVALSDTLPTQMTVASSPNASTTCPGGTVVATAGTGSISYSGGSVVAGATCTVTVAVTSAIAGTYANTTESVTSALGASAAAEATLMVNSADAPGFAKAFLPATVAPGEVSTLTFTIDNSANAIAIGTLGFADDFPDGLVVADSPNASTTCTGTVVAPAGGRRISHSGGRVAAGAACTIAVDVVGLRSGTLRNTSDDLTSDLSVTTAGAVATLTVNEAPLSVSMSFEPATISVGDISTLTYELGNGASVAATAVALSDTLPTQMTVASSPNASTTCPGGTVVATAGTGSISYSGGSVVAGATCTVTVAVTSAIAGTYANTTESVTSALGASAAAEATLMVNSADAPGFAKAFLPATVAPGEVSTLTFTIDNSANAIAIGTLGFADDFPDGLVVADSPNASTTCTGTVVAPAGGRRISHSGGRVAAGAACMIAVDVVGLRSGTLRNTSDDLTSDLSVTTAGAVATLTVNEAPLSVSMSFEPATISVGDISTLTYELGNGASVAATAVALSDTLPTQMTVASSPNASTTCPGGTVVATAGTGSISYSGGSVVAGATCTVTVAVTSAIAGTYANTTESVTSALGASAAAEATLMVNSADAPGFAKAFLPATVAPGEVSTLTFTIDNSANAIAIGTLGFADDFPDGLVVADSPNASTTCTGTVVAPAGGRRISHSGGRVAAGAACMIAVDVVGLRSGTLRNTSDDLTSDLSVTTAGAVATLTVNEAPLSVSMAFEPATISVGDISTLTYELDNGASVAATEVALSDTLPTQMTVASSPNASTTCPGGTVVATAGTGSISYSGGSVVAGATCTVTVAVTSAIAGTYANATEPVTSSLGTSAAAEATLTVTAAGAPVFTKAFSPDTVDPGGISRLTFTIDNAANSIAVGSLGFADDFPDGLVVADSPNASTTCGGTFAPAASAIGLAFTGGSVAAGAACTIAVDVVGLRSGTLMNTSDDLTSDLSVTTAGAVATLTVNEAPLSVTMSFEPATISVGDISTLTYELGNGASVAATAVSLSDTLPAAVMIEASDHEAQTTCTRGTLMAMLVNNTITFMEGSLAAGGNCTISVNVTSAVAGSYLNSPETVTSSLGTSAAAEATLTVNAADAPGFVKTFSPDTIDQGGETQIIFTVDNGANAMEMTGMAFDDPLPPGVSVAETPGIVNTCNGTFAPVADDTTLAFMGGTLAAGATCEIRVTVRAIEAGTRTNPGIALTSSIATATSPEVTLTVTAAGAPVFTKAFSPATVAPGGVSTLTFTIDNAANSIAVGSLGFADDFPDGLVVADSPNAMTTCGGTVVAPAGGDDGRITHTGGTVGAGGTCTVAVDVVGLRSGTLMNTSDDLTSDLSVTTPGASATLTVNEAPLSVSMSFEPVTISVGDISTLTYEMDNGASVAATAVALSDTLPTQMTVASSPNASTTCPGGTLVATAGTGSISYSGGSVVAGATCTITVDVTSAVAGSYSNSTETVTSSLGASVAAQATLTVNAADAPGFTKAFSPATVDPGGVSTLTFTIDNAANAIEVGSLAFDDNFPTGLVVAATPNASTTCGGTFAPAASATSLAFTGGSVAADATCMIAVDVRALQVGTLSNLSGDLASDLSVTTPGASATLTVNEAPLSVSMSFEPVTISVGDISTLTYELDNGASVAATAVALSDTLPTQMTVASSPNASTTCPGGTLVATAGTGSISYSGGSVAAGATCTITVDVTSAVAGSYSNSTESVTSSLGDSESAEATLTVNAADAPGFVKAFSPDTIDQGGETQIIFTVDNGANAMEMTGMAFDDPLPSGVSVAATPGIVNTCNGTFSPVAGATMLAFVDGTLAAGATCEIRVTVRAIEAGTRTNPGIALTSSIATATSPEATLTVTAAGAPVFTKAFSPATVDPGGVSRLTFTIDNAANSIAVGSLGFADDFPDGLVVADSPNAMTTCGGTVVAPAGGDDGRITHTGGTVGAGGTCTVAVDVVGLRSGTLMNTSDDLTSDLSVTTAGASATLTVNEAPLSVSMSFEPATISVGDISTLTYELDNGASVAATEVALSDTLPTQMTVASSPNASTTCPGGTVVTTAGTGSISYSSGSVVAGATCTVTVDVTSAVAGSYPNSTESVTSSLGDSESAEATLTVNAADAPGFVKAFSPDTIDQGGETQIIFTVDNGANAMEMTGMAFDDPLPPGVSVAATPGIVNTCNGTFSPVAGATMLAFVDGTLAAGATCEIRVTVRAIEAGTRTNPGIALTSSIATATSPEATLTVTAAGAPVFTKAFSPATVDPGGVSRLTFTIDNAANSIAVGSLGFADDFPDGLVVADSPNAMTTCGGTVVAPAGGDDGRITHTGGTVGAGGTCTIAVDVRALQVGTLSNLSGDLVSDLSVTTPGASATLVVNEAPLSVSMAFEPTEIAQGGVSRLTYELNNGAAIEATAVSLSDMLPTDLVVAADPNVQNDCGGTLTVAAAGTDTITYSGGSLVADSTCTISIAVTSAVAGSYPNETESVTSALGTSTPAQATLIVNPADALGFAKAFSPTTVAPGGISTLTFTIDNLANSIAVGSLAFIDFFPDGLVVADSPSAETTCGGMFAPAASEAGVAFTGGSVAAGQSCTLSVEVQALRSGMLENISNELTSDLPAAHQRAVATLAVNEVPLSVTLSFEPTAIAQGGVSRLTYKLDNGAAIEASEVSLSDTLPDDVVVADLPDAQTTCTAGTLTAAADSETITFTSGSLAAGGSCTISIDVTSAVAGSYSNETESVTSSLGDSESAEATLTVNAADAPGFVKAFSPDTIDQGGETQIIFTVDNGANAMEMTGMAFDDPLPPGVSVAATPGIVNTCNGTFSPVAGATTLAFTDGMLAADAMCEIRVTVRAIEAGTRTNPGIALTSSIATATSPEVTLTVTAAGALGFTKAFSPATVDPGGISRLTFTIDNTANRIAVGTLRFSDFFPDGLVVADSPNAETTCGGTFAPAASVTEVPFTGGSVAAGQSCTLSVEVQALRSGVLENVSGGLTSDLPSANQRAVATLTVNEAPLSVSMSFEPATISVGDISTLTYELDNGASVAATAVALSDTLPTQMTVASSPNASTTCPGGTLVATAGTGSISYSGGSVVAGATCTITVAVTSADAGTYANATERATSSLGASAAAEATLMVNSADAPGFAKAFLPATVAPGEVSTLTFTIDNSANAIAIGTLGFADDFPDGLVVADSPNASTTCTGTVVAPAGGRRISHSGGRVAAGAACTIAVDVVGLRSGTLRNTSDDLTSDLSVTTAGAVATLTVNEAPLSVSLSFEPATISVGDISTLTYELGNGASVAATEVSLSDTLPTQMTVASSPNASTTCPGGTVVATAGTGSISYSGGSVAAGATCTVTVAVTSAIVGTYVNATESVTSALGTSTPAEATLTVNAADAPGFVKVFSPDTIGQGGETQIIFTVDNGANAMEMTGMAFTDDFPNGLVVAGTPNASTTCGGTFDPDAGDMMLSFMGGTLAAGATCEIRVTVRAIGAGTLTNPAINLTSSIATATSAATTLTVTAADAPGFAKAFSPATVDPGGVSTLTFTIDNAANATEVESLAFTDNFPAGLVVADSPSASTICGGTFAPAAGDISLAFAGGSVAAGQSCTLSVDVRALRAGALANQSGALTSDLTVTTPGVSATLTVNEAPLTVSMSFVSAVINPGGVSRLTYELNNDAAIGATAMSLSDMLPTDLVVAADPNVRNDCGGTLTAAADANMITFMGGLLAAGDRCTIMIDVTSATPGRYVNRTELVISSLGTSTPAQATLIVDQADAPVFTKAFLPDTVDPGDISRLTFTINNSSNLMDAGDLAFNDTFPPGMIVAQNPNAETSCGGTFAPAAGDISLAFAGGSVAAGQSCTLSVDVRALRAGALANQSGALTSDLTVTTPGVSATLTVNEAPLSVSMSFEPTEIAQGGVSRLTYELNNGAAVEATAVSLSDMLPTDLVVAADPNVQNDCGGTLTVAAAGTDTITYSGGSLVADSTCTISIAVTSAVAGSYPNETESVTSALGSSTPAQATLIVNPADALGFAKAFSPTTVAPGGISTLTFTIDNLANSIAVGSLAFIDFFPDGLVVADSPSAETTCGGMFAPAASEAGVAFTGGSVAAGQSCTLSVEVQALRSGMLENISNELTSDLPAAHQRAVATLAVNEVPLSVTLSFEPTAIAQGGVSRLTYKLDNGAAIEASEVSLSDTLPDDVVVADLPDAQTTCTDGTLTAAADSETITFTSGSLAAGGSCTISIDVTSAVAGSYSNSTESVTSSLGDSESAEATLTVNAADAPGFVKAFSPDTIDQGGETQIIFTVDNGANAMEMTGMAFDDPLPPGVSVAATPGIVNTCNGTFSPVAGATMLAFVDGTLAAGATCEIRVTVRAIEAGTRTNPGIALTSSIATATSPEATLTVTAAGAPVFTKAFSPATVDPGGVSRLTFTIDNAANSIAVGSLGFADDFPDGLVVADSPNAMTTCGGTVVAPAGGDDGRITHTGGTVGAGGTCTIAVDVRALQAGTLSNLSGDLASDLSVTTPGASATLTVHEAPLSVSMAFEPTEIAQGGVSRLTYELDNGASAAATAVALSDTLPDDVVVADLPDAQTTCTGGTLVATAGTGSISYSGGSVAAGATCTVTVAVTSADAGTYTNTTESVTSALGTSTPAQATLMVRSVGALGFAKAFSPATVAPGEISTLTFTIDNAVNFIEVGSLAFTDIFPDGLVVAGTPNMQNSCGGTFAPQAGATSLAFSGGRVAAFATCTLAVDVQSMAFGGEHRNVSGELTSDLSMATAGVVATLAVNEAPLSVSMAFEPTEIAQGGVSRLTYELDNGASVAATAVALSDTLPDDVVVADLPDAQTTCTDGTLVATAGTGSISYSGGSVAAGATCTITVAVTSADAGIYTNTIESVTSALGTSTPAQATLMVHSVGALGFAKAFSPATVAPGGISTLTFTIDNAVNFFEVGSLAFTDIFPDGLVVAGTPNMQNSCGGTFAPQAGATSLAFSGGRVAADATCVIAVDVRALQVGTLSNLSGDLASDLSVTTPGASATLTVHEAPLSVSMAFAPETINQGDVSRLTYALDNGASVAATAVALSDTLPDDVVVADLPDAQTTCTGGTLVATAGTGSISYSGGSVAAGATCTVTVAVTSADAGTYTNTTESVTSALGTSTPAQATLMVRSVGALGFAKAFSPATVAPGEISTLTFTIDNAVNFIEVGSLAFTDIFPDGLVVAGTPNMQNSCGGTFAPQAGATSLAFSGGRVAAFATCTLAVDVQSMAFGGEHRNVSGELTSDLSMATAGVVATLAVNEAPLSVSMSFEPTEIAQGGVSRLTYELNNGAAVEATAVSLSDMLPTDLAVAADPNVQNGCGGTLAAMAGGGTITYSGGSLGASTDCTIMVDVTSATPASYLNHTESVTSSLGTSTPAQATLTVDSVDALGFTKVFSPATVDPGGVSRLTFTIDNSDNLIDIGSLAFTDAFPEGLVVAAQPNVSTTCGGTVVAPAGGDDGRITHTGGTVAAGETCTIAVDVQALRAGALANQSGALTSDLPMTTPGASATLVVNEAPLSVSMMFEPTEIAQGGVSRLTYELNNGAAVEATAVSLSDMLPTDLAVAADPNVQNGCGGTLAAMAGGGTITYSGGSLGASTDCTIMVDVTSATPASYLNHTESVTSSLGTSTPAQATLTVDSVDALGFTKVFSPATVDPGGVSRLTFTIDNLANSIEVGSLGFADDFPDGLVVADSPNAMTTCGGTVVAPAGGDDGRITHTGGTVAAGETCTIAVDVQALRAGALANQSGALTSNLPMTTPGASATLVVNEAPLSVSMMFEPTEIAQGGVSRLTYTLENVAAVAATSVALSNPLPEDVVVASNPNAVTTCTGGTLTAVASGTSIEYSGGAVDASGSCMITVAVTSRAVGSHANSTASVASSLGTSVVAEATLTVEEAESGTVTFNVESDIDGTFGFSTSEPDLAASLAVSDGTGSTGALPVAVGSHSVAVAGPRGAVLAAIDCDDTDSTADVSAETISLVVDALEDITCTITVQSSIAEAIKTINSFLTRRADLVLSSEPDPQRRFDRLSNGSGNASRLRLSGEDLEAFSLFTAQGSRGDYQASTSLLQARQAAASATLARGSSVKDATYVENYRFDAWFDGQYKEFDDGANGDGYFAIAYAGVDYLLTPDILLGTVVSFDSMEEKTDTSTASGFGWMVGPQLTARLGSHLYFDGRIAAGRSENRVSPFNTYTDDFWTWRWLSSASLTGEFQYDNWTIRPHTSLSYFEERQKSYVDSLGAEIPGQTVRLGQLKLGPTFIGHFESAEGQVYSPYLTVDAIYNLGDTTGVTLLEPDRPEVEGWRGNLEAGVSMVTDGGSRLSLGASYDGLGQSDFEAWGVMLEFSSPIGKSKMR